MKFSIKLSDFRNKPKAVFVSEIGRNRLIDAGVLADESRKESRAAGGLGERAHNVIGLKKCNLVQTGKPGLKIQASQLSHGDGVDHRVGGLSLLQRFPVSMFADVCIEAGAQEKNRFLTVHSIEPLQRVVDCVVQACFAIGWDSHPPQAVEQLGFVLGEVGEDLGPNIKGDKRRPVVRPQAVDESGCGSDDIVKIISKSIAEFR